jgi:hypothetical protein
VPPWSVSRIPLARDELDLVAAVDLHAGHGLEDGQHPVEDDVRALLGVEQRLVGVAPLLAGAEVEIILGLDAPGGGKLIEHLALNPSYSCFR